MPKQLNPAISQPSTAQNTREEALRRLSRSPHPYHRQKVDIAHPSERLAPRVAPPVKSPLRSAQGTDDEQDNPISAGWAYKESTNSDSGTEADDEHFLKGLPAPKLRPHKGLRGAEICASSSPSPLASPGIPDVELFLAQGFFRRTTIPSPLQNGDEARKAAEIFREKRKIEIIRRATEAGLMVFVAGVLCSDVEIRTILYIWKKELACQFLIIGTLIVLYPLRLIHHVKPSNASKAPTGFGLPAAFDPAPLIYPLALTMLVSLVLSRNNPMCFLPSIILGLSSLPRNLIPSTGGIGGSYLIQWMLSCAPLLISKIEPPSMPLDNSDNYRLNLVPEILVLLCPLHQALCTTLESLTTTSLLPAELQLLSISLIDLLLLASSPQATILKALLWGGGIGLLVTCTNVLRWGVALARVPKWRFRRSGDSQKSARGKSAKFVKKAFSFGMLGTSIFARDASESEYSSDEDPIESLPSLKLNTETSSFTRQTTDRNGSVSAIEPKHTTNFINVSKNADPGESFSMSRRHTLPILNNLPSRSNKRTPSGRRKRASSSTVQAFFSLTHRQATIRKWMYAMYVYLCVLGIILVCIREYVGKYALYGNEPVGWALGYLFGDLPRFRMEVVIGNFQRWICLPPRNGNEHEESCHMGWVEHLRHSSFGEANSRLILCVYWLAIIVVGLAIVFRLSSIYEVDTRRKVFHFMMVAMLLPATYVDPTFAALALVLMLAIFLLLDLFRASQLPPLSQHLAYFLTPYVDGRDLKGPVVISHIFLLIGCAIPLWLSLASLPRTGMDYLVGWEVPTREVSMVSGVICVGLGDAAASLIGRRYGRRKWVWGGGKSIEGSVAFATAVALALILAKAWLKVGGWPTENHDAWFMTLGKSGVAAWVASLTEAVLTGGNDNVVVPVVLWLCVKGLDI